MVPHKVDILVVVQKYNGERRGLVDMTGTSRLPVLDSQEYHHGRFSTCALGPFSA
jgi:hypothetical protein